jgi:hypothetical protein
VWSAGKSAVERGQGFELLASGNVFDHDRKSRFPFNAHDAEHHLLPRLNVWSAISMVVWMAAGGLAGARQWRRSVLSCFDSANRLLGVGGRELDIMASRFLASSNASSVISAILRSRYRTVFSCTPKRRPASTGSPWASSQARSVAT